MRNRTLGESFGCAFLGVAHAVRTQRNFRLHLCAAALVVAVAAGLGLRGAELAVLLLTIGLVIVAEVLNTAFETVIDLVSPGFHPLAGTAKNLAAAAVVLAALFAVAVGCVVLGPELLRRLAGR